MPDPYNIPLTGAQISSALQATYTIDKTASQVNDAINAAIDTADPVSSGSTKLVQGGAVDTAINNQATLTTAEIVAKIRSVMGWGSYVDSQYTSGSPLNSSNAKTQITIDGLGSGSNTDYLPTGVTDLWSTVDNKITPAAEGDAYDLRLDFTAEPTASTDFAEVTIDIGGAGTIPVATRTVTFAKTGATSFSIGFPIYCLATFLANGGKIYFDTSVSGDTIDIYDISLLIKRDFTALT